MDQQTQAEGQEDRQTDKQTNRYSLMSRICGMTLTINKIIGGS